MSVEKGSIEWYQMQLHITSHSCSIGYSRSGVWEGQSMASIPLSSRNWTDSGHMTPGTDLHYEETRTHKTTIRSDSYPEDFISAPNNSHRNIGYNNICLPRPLQMGSLGFPTGIWTVNQTHIRGWRCDREAKVSGQERWYYSGRENGLGLNGFIFNFLLN